MCVAAWELVDAMRSLKNLGDSRNDVISVLHEVTEIAFPIVQLRLEQIWSLASRVPLRVRCMSRLNSGQPLQHQLKGRD